MKRIAALLALLALSLPLAATAQSLRLLDSLVVEYRGDNDNAIAGDDDYGIALNKLYLTGQMDRTSVSAQIDMVVFSNYPDVPNPTPSNPSAYSSEARLERLALVHRFGDASLTVGDAHLQLGRGIALSLRKVDELGTDQALRGGTVHYSGDNVSSTFFAGRTNIANLDGVTQRFLEDPDDTLAGASGTLHLGRADLSLHGLVLLNRTPTSSERDDDRTILGGAYLDLPATDWLSLYLEGAIQEYRIIRTDQQGTALYGSADVDLQVISLLLEGLWLDHFQVAGSFDRTLQLRNVYNQPPTLERIDQEVLDNTNVRGGRAKVSRSFLDGGLVVYGSGMLRQYGAVGSEVDQLHGYGGFELTYDLGRSRWYASGGYRHEYQAGDTLKTMSHGETDWVQSIGNAWALHVTVNHESRTLLDHAYDRGSTLLGFDRTHLGSVMAEVGYDTFNLQRQNLFLAGIIAWEYERWLQMRAVVGSQRGGIKCIGGVCRDFPAFNGARLEASVQYDLL